MSFFLITATVESNFILLSSNFFNMRLNSCIFLAANTFLFSWSERNTKYWDRSHWEIWRRVTPSRLNNIGFFLTRIVETPAHFLNLYSVKLCFAVGWGLCLYVPFFSFLTLHRFHYEPIFLVFPCNFTSLTVLSCFLSEVALI